MRIHFLYLLLFFFTIGYSQRDSTKVKELLDIAYSYEKTSMDSAIYTYKEAAKLGKEIEYWIGAGRATSYTGIVYSDYGMNDSAIVYHKRSIPLYEKAKYRDGKASSLINLGNAYLLQGNYEQSADYYLLGIDEYEKLQDTARLIYAYGNFASLFSDFKMFDKSKEFQTKALNYSYKVKDTISVGYLLNDLGLTLLSLNEKENALNNFNQALVIANKYNDEELKYFSNKNLNNYHFGEGNFDMAYQFAIKSFKNAIATKKPYYESYSLNALGTAHLKLNNIDSASYYVQKSIKKASEIGAKELLMDAYFALNQVYLVGNKHKEAYDALQEFIMLQDSIVGRQKQEYITRLEQQYQVKNKDNEILLQQLTIQENEALIQKKINQNGLYLIGILALFFTSFILWYRHRQKQKLNAQSIETLKKQQEIQSLAALIEGEDMERSRIAKDLHDSVNANLSVIKYNLTSISTENIAEEDLQTFNQSIDMIDSSCEQIRNISNDLAPPSLMNYGLIEALEQYCNRINSSNTIKVTFQHFGDSLILAKKIEATIYHILQELITNSVKHAKAKIAMIQINISNALIHITAEDDGIGYDTSVVTHGLGLNNIRSRVEFLNAEMDIKSDKKGTSVTINIDLNKIPRL